MKSLFASSLRRLCATPAVTTATFTSLTLSLLAATSSHAATLNVGSGQTYTTLQAAFNVANPGDIILLKGNLPNPETATLTRSGTSGNRIIIRSEYGNAQATVTGRIIINAQYVRLEGLLMEGLNGSVYNPDPAVDIRQSYNEVVGMHIRNYAAWGIKFSGASTDGVGYAAYNYIYNCGSGIHMARGTTAEFNTLERMNRHGSSDAGDAPADYFRVFGSNINIRNNLAYGTLKSEVGDQHPDFVHSWNNGSWTNVVVDSNVAVGPYMSQGIMINYHSNETGVVDDWTIRNNVFTNWTGSGIDVQRGQNFLVENNTLAGHPRVSAAGHYGVRFSGTGGSGVVRNNMVIDCEASGTTAASSATMDKAYNFYFGGSIPAPGTGDITTEPPQFMDKSNANFRLWSTSPAINAGQNRTFDWDLENKNRPSGGFDMGAYEAAGFATILHPAEYLVVQDSSPGDVTGVISDSSANGGLYRHLAANTANDFITLRVAVPTPGSYNVKVRVRRTSDRGIYRLAIGEPGVGYVDIGGTFDCYSSTFGFVEFDLGSIVVEYPTSLYFRLTCTGKNASSGGYKLSLDTIKLTSIAPAVSEIISDNSALLNPYSFPTITTPDGQVDKPWLSSTNTSGYYGDDYLHDNNEYKGQKTFTFVPGLVASGNYKIYTRHTASSTRASNVPFDIVTSGGTTTTVYVDQRVNGGTWVLLGTYNLDRSTASVKIRTTGTTGHVIADAVRFEPVP